MTKTINFVLASNQASSITRLVAEYANQLVKRGVDVYISYPILSFWDYFVWRVEKETAPVSAYLAGSYRFLKFWKYLFVLAIKGIIKSKGLRWQGELMQTLDPRVKMNCFLKLPSARNMPDADVLVVMQNYLVPRLLFLPASKGKIIGSVHMDYQEMLKDRDEATRGWWQQFLFVEQHLRIPRFAVSVAAKTSAETLGVAVNCVINNGINLQEFSNLGRPAQSPSPLRIMLFCALLFEKGQDFGCAVVRELKKIYNSQAVQFVSVGQVKDKYKNLFDENLGYLCKQNYVQAYQQADIFIYPSLRDGFPAPPLEALACGCALVTTAVQGVVEYGIHEKNCLMCEPNDLENMVKNVQRLITDYALRQKLCQAGLETVKKYSWEQCAEQLINFMDGIL